MIAIPSFAKINLGLKIGPARPDGFHELRTVYQTLALHDVIRVDVVEGEGIEIRCDDPRVPLDSSNTCYKIAERALAQARANLETRRGEKRIPRGLTSARDDKNEGGAYGAAEAAPLQKQVEPDGEPSGAARMQGATRGRIIIEIEKRLPVQGGMGAASSNAIAAMIGLERALRIELSPQEELRIAAEVGSDLPLFLIGGTVLGVGRGEEVFPLPDLPPLHVVVVTPAVGVSTPRAFARWDDLATLERGLTGSRAAGTINQFSQSVFAWLGTGFPQVNPASGVPARGGDRAETPLLDLVRAGIENDFEKVVFPEYPDLREVKGLLQREGASYASLSGSGSTLYGLFASEVQAQAAAERMTAAGHVAVATTTLTRDEYWKQLSGARD
jgi:4-diphosphocytidyl-2-C-methyl-D-erythritol kinase